MLGKFCFCAGLFIAALTVNGETQIEGFDKSAFYDAMAANNLEAVNNLLNSLKTASIAEKDGFEGALLMKKAGLMSKPKEKLSLFKTGRTKLENAIKKNPDNIEFLFLRLIIQEHAPKAVNYNSNLESDAAAIRLNYKSLSSTVKQAISDYSKKSTQLKLP